MSIRLTKVLTRKLLSQHIGTGVLILKTADDTLLTVEVYQKADGTLRCMDTGLSVLPVTLTSPVWDDRSLYGQ